ncbi:MAG: nucleoside 2-deoxyribosyltransferase [Nanoarchaeota archaeon]|nr:nucleoside 2-deoxyribosyltransferase [Nanoarchaeota archaeon]
MKIYFAGSIRGGRDDVDWYHQIIDYLKKYGKVLTEHVGDKNLKPFGEKGLKESDIHDRDFGWMLQSDVVIAEVSIPSLGVGYEIARAIENGKRVLCLYRPKDGKMLSAMIAGSDGVINKEYRTLDEAKKIIDNFFKLYYPKSHEHQ